jgi:hypothetical protein
VSMAPRYCQSCGRRLASGEFSCSHSDEIESPVVTEGTPVTMPPGVAVCMMEGCDFGGGGACVNCFRLRCTCGAFIAERTADAHYLRCAVLMEADRREQEEIMRGPR